MLRFKYFLSESRGTIKGSGSELDRHKKTYIDPFIGSKQPTHTVAKEHEGIAAGSQVKLHGTEMVKNKLHAIVSQAGSSKKTSIPVTKLHKPGEEPENKGTKFESEFFNRMASHGLTPKNAKAAGSTAGTDVPIVNKKTNKINKGKVQSSESVFHGEVKADVSAAMGQLTIRHDSAKGGWHIPEEARAKRPGYAKQIEQAGIIDHMNKHHDPEKHGVVTTASGRAQNVVMKHPNMEPANAYLKDHHAHFVHVGDGFGTYRVGARDATGHGLPALSGTGKWTVRQKQGGNPKSRTVMFQPDGKKGLKKSHVNLENDDHLQEFKKSIGHA